MVGTFAMITNFVEKPLGPDTGIHWYFVTEVRNARTTRYYDAYCNGVKVASCRESDGQSILKLHLPEFYSNPERLAGRLGDAMSTVESLLVGHPNIKPVSFKEMKRKVEEFYEEISQEVLQEMFPPNSISSRSQSRRHPGEFLPLTEEQLKTYRNLKEEKVAKKKAENKWVDDWQKQVNWYFAK
jgi:hypothetical protein